MSETHAPFWIYGSGLLQLEFAPSSLTRHVTIDGRAGLALRAKGWHLVAVDIDRLVKVGEEKRKVGLKLLRVTTSP
jgi:2-phospho-L-lactate guanylyltransferase (CobY/MobA/RfbA family)